MEEVVFVDDVVEVVEIEVVDCASVADLENHIHVSIKDERNLINLVERVFDRDEKENHSDSQKPEENVEKVEGNQRDRDFCENDEVVRENFRGLAFELSFLLSRKFLGNEKVERNYKRKHDENEKVHILEISNNSYAWLINDPHIRLYEITVKQKGECCDKIIQKSDLHDQI